MSYMDEELRRMEAERAAAPSPKPKNSLLSRLKKGMAKRAAIGAAVLTTAAAGWGLASHFQSESRSSEAGEREASIEYRVQSSKLNLGDASFNVLAPVNLKKMNKSQLAEYQYFTGSCAKYLRMLNNDTENGLNDMISGRIDPAQRLGMMYQALDDEIQAKGDELLKYGGENEGAAREYQILGKVRAQLEALEGQVKSGGSRAERFDKVQALYQHVSQKCRTAGTLRSAPQLQQPMQRGENTPDF